MKSEGDTTQDKVELKRGNIAVSPELWEKLNVLSKRLPNYNPTQLGIACIQAVLDMAETPPTEREVPSIVRVIDTVQEAGEKLLKTAKKSVK